MTRNDDALLDAARELAVKCLGDRVYKNDLQLVASHLLHGRDVQATLRLLDGLTGSWLGYRRKYEALRQHVRPVLQGQSDWRRAARLVSWASRFSVFVESEGSSRGRRAF